ncbi:sugar ABC transporter ATP-binding protein [Conexibacter arvalis]|uniref:Ribose transport system ATP-binding protein n=1 Tax=Conexibacter arvalis TaxID=912552 RepID=A0A840ICZ0_9ACTN|nr:sugar ABC transporter ATP-binding protein [Conexibacter arvalis]MBB4662111.1 ribose transport system ATP-binding protein [Conexibacter arvalis]
MSGAPTTTAPSAAAPAGAAADGVLDCRGITKSYGGARALEGVDLALAPGEVVALLGENGAGKSTLSKVLTGVVSPDAGAMRIGGEPYVPARPADALSAGVAMIHQELRLVPELSIAENVFVGDLPMRGGRVDRTRMRREAAAQLERVGLATDPDRPVRELSVAAQQQVEIAKALHRDSRFLILDEPTAPLGEEETAQLFAQMDRLRREGVGMLYISHRLEEIARVADRIVVLRDGRRVAAWDRGDVPVDEVIRAMVGREVGNRFPAPAPPREEIVLRARGLTRSGAFEDVSLELRAGEVLGIAGLVGAGRTELVRAICGADRLDAGTIELADGPVTLRSPRAAVKRGVVLVPEDRKAQGALLDLPLEDNVALPSLDRLTRHGALRSGRLRDNARELIERLQIKAEPRQPVGSLSGGNQQKAVIAKWLPCAPRVMVFDEPTRGVDVGARPSIYAAIRRLTEEGAGVIVVSSELEEVLGLANRVLVMSRGRCTGTLEREQATPERVMALAAVKETADA